MEAGDEPPRRRRGGGVMRMRLPEGQRFVVTGLSLVTDPASASAVAAALPAPLVVHVWAEVGVGVGHGARVVGIGTLSLENPVEPVRPAVELGGDGECFVLRHDSASATVRLYGHCLCLDPLNPEGEGETTRRRTCFVEGVRGAEEVPDGEVEEEEEDICSEQVPDGEEGGVYAEEVPGEEEDGIYDNEEVLEEEEEHEVGVEYEPLTLEDMAERYDSDNGEDDDEEDRHPRKGGEAAGESSERKRNSIALVDAPAGVVVPAGEFLGPPQFAAVKNTAGFIRIAAAGTGSQQEGNNNNKEILVLYRYTRFSRTWSGRRGVEACRRTKLHWLRFAVPAAGDMESALAWAGSSLGPLIYPRLFRRELGNLWSSLLASAAVIINAAGALPPQATRLQVVVDAGILRREDYTAERMAHVRGALEAAAGEAWPELYHVGMELRLPEPVMRREEGGDGDGDGGATRPAKRRRVVVVEEGEECSLCLDPLEMSGGLAAWPGCGHVFHGQCVKQTLTGSATCPLCRQHLCADDDAFVC